MKFPTAKEVMAREALRPLSLMDDERLNLKPKEVVNAMLEFARMHVTAALKAAAEKALISGTWDDEFTDDRLKTRDQDGNWIDVGADGNSILNAYPLENIK